MAINTTNSFSGPFLTNGATKVFPFTFTAPSAAEVSVLLRAANGVETAGAGFVVTVNPNGGGSVTFAVAPAAGSQLLILLNPYFTQQIEFENGSAWLAEPVNEQADRSALRDQVLKRDIGRALLVPVGTPGAVMPSLQSIRGKFLSVNADDEFYGADGTGADGAMRSDLASTTAGKGAALVAREDGESVETSLTAIEGSLGGIVALGQFNRLLSKLDSDSADANVVILSDSTGDAVDEWPYLLFGGRVANAYPAWTIKIRYWVGAAYAAAVTLQNGTGVHTLTVYAGAIAGTVASRFAGEDFAAGVSAPNPDVVILSYGHNGDIQGLGPYTSATIRQLSFFNGIADRLDKDLPNVPVVMIGQNPSTNNNGTNPAGTDDGFMRRRLDLLRPLAQRHLWGFINVHDAFLQAGVALATLLLDNTHPNPTGSQLWADTVWGVMRASRGAQGTGGAKSPVLLKAWRNFDAFDTWSKGNITLTEQTTAGRFQTAGESATATITDNTGLGYIYTVALGAADIALVRGRYVTFAVWMRIPAASAPNAGRIDLVDGVSPTATSAGATKGNDFVLFTATMLVAPTANSLTINLYSADAGTAPNPASVVDLDRASLALGVEPVDPVMA